MEVVWKLFSSVLGKIKLLKDKRSFSSFYKLLALIGIACQGLAG